MSGLRAADGPGNSARHECAFCLAAHSAAQGVRTTRIKAQVTALDATDCDWNSPARSPMVVIQKNNKGPATGRQVDLPQGDVRMMEYPAARQPRALLPALLIRSLPFRCLAPFAHARGAH